MWRAGEGQKRLVHSSNVWAVVVSPSCSLVAHASPAFKAAWRTAMLRAAAVGGLGTHRALQARAACTLCVPLRTEGQSSERAVRRVIR